MAKPRLLVATSTWPLHPGDRRTPFVRNLGHDLAAEGWDVLVSAPHAPGAARRELDEALAVERFRYGPDAAEILAYGAGGLINMRSPLRKAIAAPFVGAQILALAGAVHRFRPDLIHAHWTLPQGFSAIAAACGRIPVVTTIHGGDVFGLRSPLFRPFKRAALHFSTAVTVNSPATRDAALALGANPARISMIHMPPACDDVASGADAAAWRASFPADAFIALFVGRLIPEKGPDDFLRAIAATGLPNIHGVVVGSGPMLDDLKRMAAELGIASRVRFEGWLSADDVAVRGAGADAFLGPSKQSPDGWVEAQGIVFLEAMRNGIHTLGPRSGGVPGIVRNGETGWLFEPGCIERMAALLAEAAQGTLDADGTVRATGQRFASSITRASTARLFSRLFHGILNDDR